MDYDLSGGVFGDIANKLFMEGALKRQMRHSNENLKTFSEAQVHTPA